MINLPDKYKALCAKTDKKQNNMWLPLWMHLTDVAEVMDYLCCHWLSKSAKDAIGLGDEELRRLCRFLGMTHDLGKSTTLFQYQITRTNTELNEKMIRAGWDIDSGKLNAGVTKHAMAGEAILLNMGCPASCALIVGSHHGKPSNKGQAKRNLQSYPWNYYLREDGTDQWSLFWECWLENSLTDAGYETISQLPDIHMRAQMILSGLLIMADWIASNTSYFPLVDIEDEPQTDIYPLRTEKALNQLAFSEKNGWKEAVQTEDDFLERFGFYPNSIQMSFMEVASRCIKPGIFILEAQMGIGKTEAALAAVEICAKKIGAEGFFFGLPTQATADGIFSRLGKWGEKLSESNSHSIRLVHGMAEFNEDYQALKCGTLNLSDEDEWLFDGMESDHGLIVHEWFSGRKKALLADYVVGTVDQLLMADLKQKHVMLRHLGLAGKVAVVDECHAYDAYMNQYLQGTLRWLGAYNIPVILLSATLPAASRRELIRAYTNQEESGDNYDPENRAYPLLTWSDQGTVLQAALPQENNRRLNVGIIWDKEEIIAENLQYLLEEGGCAGIIVNTVQRAQNIYNQLSSAMTGVSIILCHAQMLGPDRLEKERKITDCVGKESGKTDRSRVIIIGTSVLEQSLDIDFDVLYSDLCPMDLLLQRIGRLHRHAHHDSIRGKRLEKPICHVLCGIEPELEKGASVIYGDYLLLRTKALLPETIVIPDSIPDLVQNTYDDKNDFGLGGEDYLNAKEAYLLKTGKKGKKAAVYQITDPDMKKSYNQRKSLYGLLKEDIADRESRAEAAVRDVGNTIDVLLLMQDEDGEIRFLPWQNEGAYVRTYCVPSEEECMVIARQRICLPHRFCHEGIIDQTINELEHVYEKYFYEWKDSIWLGREMILLLDYELKAELDGVPVKYSQEKGLMCGKEDDA